MADVLEEENIDLLIKMPKALPRGWRKKLKLSPSKGDAHLKRDMEIACCDYSFSIKCRQSLLNPLDFSIILAYINKGHCYRLLRCNGKHSCSHTNHWEKREGQTGYKIPNGFHIHRATQRYQEIGLDIDSFADATNSYSDYESALSHFLKLCNFIDPDEREDLTLDLFSGDPQ